MQRNKIETDLVQHSTLYVHCTSGVYGLLKKKHKKTLAYQSETMGNDGSVLLWRFSDGRRGEDNKNEQKASGQNITPAVRQR